MSNGYEGEEWRPVVGFEGHYEVSSLGRIRSLTRRFPGTRSGKPVTVSIQGRLMKTQVSTTGYSAICLYRNGQQYGYQIHRLVAAAFIGPCPVGMECCHNNGDNLDNRATNLRYDTPSENQLDVVRHGHHYWANRTHCANGHPFSSENTRPRADGGRRCLTCLHEQQRAYQRRKRERAREAA